MISSADNKPIVGVSVYVEGTTVGATSDINGNYTLKVPAGTKHVTFAFLGYDTKKIAVADVELFKLVTLIEASNVMDDVVVVAFGTQKKESLVGAVQVVRPSTLKVTSSNLSTSFAGKIAGVTINASAAGVGGETKVVMRGSKSIAGSNNALYVLDGIPLPSLSLTNPGDEFTIMRENNLTGDGISNFNLDDIASMAALTGPSAAALYGSQAANGVLMLTTRS